MSEGSAVRVWRLVKARRAAGAFDGEGARRYGGRWNSRGRRAVYGSESLALALLEILVHLDPAAGVPPLVALSVEIPGDGIAEFEPPARRRSAFSFPWSLDRTRAWGDEWLAAGASAALRVPSAIVPSEWNYLINPRHPAFAACGRSGPQPFPFDPTLGA